MIGKEIKENYGLKIKSKEKEGDRKRWEMLEKSVTHTVGNTVEVNTEQGLAICLIIGTGGYSAWEGAASCSSRTLFVSTFETERYRPRVQDR